MYPTAQNDAGNGFGGLFAADGRERLQRGDLFLQGVFGAEAGEAAAVVLKYWDGGGNAAAAGFQCQNGAVRGTRCRDRGQQRRIVEVGRE